MPTINSSVTARKPMQGGNHSAKVLRGAKVVRWWEARLPWRAALKENAAIAVALVHYGFPFAIGTQLTPIARFRARARYARFANSRRATHWLARSVMTLGWPPAALVSAVRTYMEMRTHGQAGRGIPVFCDMLWLALRRSIPPVEYGLYRLDLPERRRDADAYVYWNDQPGLAAINARRGADPRGVRDKVRFAEICAQHGLPHVPTLAAYRNGRQVSPPERFVPSLPVLWTKPIEGSGGRGATRWSREGEAYVAETSEDGVQHRVASGRLAGVLQRRNCLVQPCLRNHAAFDGLGNSALASLRVVTGLDAAGRSVVVATMLLVPQGVHVTSQGGICCGVDPQTGVIRRAVGLDGADIARHPDTGRAIAGVHVPFWQESLALARRAHETAFARFAFLGWDIALTQDGPLLLEANAGWGAMQHQLLDGPLGRTEFARLVALHV